MKTRILKILAIALTLAIIANLFVFEALVSADNGPKFSDWCEAVNLGPVINSGADDACPTLSKDGLSLYFRSNRSGGYGDFDIYVSQRGSLNDPWGTPVNLGSIINSLYPEFCTGFSIDGHWMLFVSILRPGGFGMQDIYLSHRKDNRDDFGWETPRNLGSVINTSGFENGPCLFTDEDTGKTLLYFTRGNLIAPNPYPGYDIYVSEVISLKDLTFGPATPVTELNVAGVADYQPAVRKDGLEVVFASSRTGSLSPLPDLWVSTRESTSDPWSTPVNLGSKVNSTGWDFHPTLSWDATTMIFASDRAGGSGLTDLYICTRIKLKGPKE